MVRSAAPRALVFLAALALAAAACADHNPAGPRVHPPEIAPPPVQAALRCRMDVRAETLACGPAAPETAPGISPLIIGGQGTNVRLRSSGTSYDGSAGVFRSEVAVENLMAQALGTDDGVFPAPQGVRVFFQTGPTVTQGSGQVRVANSDGEAVFTAGAQPYFQYAGLLAPGDTSAAREWRFEVPSSVEFFEFTVLVSAPVPGETPPSAALFILAGAGVTDTVDAEPDSVLRIGVRGADGKPAANTRVEVEGKGFGVEREVLVAPVGGSFYYYTSAFTDSRGIAEFRVKMGTRAGPGRVVVNAPVHSLWGEASYTVAPGNVGQVRSLPADTAVLIGGRAPLRLATYDRHGNARSDAVALSVAGGPATVEGIDVVAGSSIGMVTAVATAGGFSDTSVVRVVPQGTFAAPARAYQFDQTGGIYIFSLDGSNLRRVYSTMTGPGTAPELAAVWLSPTKLVYHDERFAPYEKQLHVLDLATGASTRFLPPADRLEVESFPRVSHDGSWVYFTGGTHSTYHIHRARPDGSEAERIEAAGEFIIRNDWGADPSPDGTRIAFVRGGSGFNDEYLNLMDLATRRVTELDVLGVSPRWSPDGTRIVYAGKSTNFGARVPAIMNADGTGARILSETSVWRDINWSPDGKYIIFSSPTINDVVIIDVATGAEVVVRMRGIEPAISSPVWQP